MSTAKRPHTDIAPAITNHRRRVRAWLATLAVTGLSIPVAQAGEIIDTDTTQSGGTFEVDPPAELVITETPEGDSDPLLTLTDGADSDGVEAVVIGTTEFEFSWNHPSSGWLLIEAGSTLTNSGSGSKGTYGGSPVSGGRGYLGLNADSIGTATVTGSGSTWYNSDWIRVGSFGTGTLNIKDGGLVSNTVGYLGFNSGSEGTVTVTGSDSAGTPSTWANSSDLRVGRSGTGTLNVEDGGVVSNAEGTLGLFGTGTATVTGSSSTWSNSSHLTVGDRDGSAGTMNVENGGQVSNASGRIGLNSGSEGTVTVTGSDSEGNPSTWSSSSGLTVGRTGTGTLTIEDGGQVLTDSGQFAGDSIGRSSGSTGTVTVTGSGSAWTNSSLLTVGHFGDGTLNVEDGGQVSNTHAMIGRGDGSIGTVTVAGSGSTWNNSGVLTVGFDGEGTLNVEGGGQVSSTDGRIGRGDDSGGTVTVTGGGSTWTSSGELSVGESGNGTLNVADGGRVYLEGGLTIPELGIVNLDGGTIRFDGYDRQGTFNHTAGTIQLAGDRTVGDAAAIDDIYGPTPTLSTGFGLTVEGAARVETDVSVEGGALASHETIHIGHSNDGTLNVEGGGQVGNTDAFIGGEPGSTGTVTVTGNESTWANVGDLILGGTSLTDPTTGEGTLTISDGGTVTVDETTRIHGGNPSTVNLEAGGTLQTRVLDPSNGNFNWNGGMLAVGDEVVGGLSVPADGTLDVGDGAISGLLTFDAGAELNVQEGVHFSNPVSFEAGEDFTSLHGEGPEARAEFAEGLGLEGQTRLSLDRIKIVGDVNLRGGGNKVTARDTTFGGPVSIDMGDDFIGDNLTFTGGVSLEPRDDWLDMGDDYVTLGGSEPGASWAMEDRLSVKGNGEAPMNLRIRDMDMQAEEGVHLEGAANVEVEDATIDGRLELSGGGNKVTAQDATFDEVSIGGGGEFSGSDTTFKGEVSALGGASFAMAGPTVFQGQVSGGAQFADTTGTVHFDGGYSPGDSPGLIEFGGDIVLGEENILVMELAGLDPGNQHDQLVAVNEEAHQLLSLGGTLEVVLLDEFEPMLDDVFKLFAFDETAGTFDNIVLPNLHEKFDNDLSWETGELPDTGTISVIPEPSSVALSGLIGALLLLHSLRRPDEHARHGTNDIELNR